MRLRAFVATLLLALTATAWMAAGAFADDPQWDGQAVAHDTSPPLSSIPDTDGKGKGQGIPAKHRPGGTFADIALSKPDSKHFQSQIVGSAPPTAGNWEGVNNVDGVIPPDTNGDVGATQYVQWVNLSLRVYDKATGNVLVTKRGNAIWSGFGGLCDSTNQGDPVALYDKQHGRWILAQFAFGTDAFGNPKAPYYECIAVSQTESATGAYNRYAFAVNAGINANYFPDYPKFGVWSDALYMTTNNFNGNSFAGPGVYAFDLSKMLTGAGATFVARQLSPTYEGLLPAHADSASQVPPAGDQEYVGGIDTNSSTGVGSTFQTWRFKPDFTSPANSQFTGPVGVAVSPYNFAFCGQTYSGSCIPQRGTTMKLDPLADRLMNRLQYRRINGADVLVASHSVNVGSDQAGVRWYEFHKPDASAMTAVQQDTFAPNDGVSRWMGSAAMNANGDIALGYSAAGTGTYPSIRFTGRLFGDPLNTMTLGEGTIAAGGGSQTGYSRWGDYSSMSVDPSDDTTFWYTQEYYGATSSYGWQTRIGSFKLVAPAPPALTGVSMNPSTVNGGNSSTGTVTLGSPAPAGGVSVALSSNNGSVQVPASVPVPAGATSANFAATTSAVSTTTTATITAGYGGATKTASLTVNPAPPASFTLSASPTSRTVKRNKSTTYTITVNKINGFGGSVALSLAGLPNAATASFSPNPTTGSSTLTVKTTNSTVRKTYTLTITGMSGTVTPDPTTTVTLKVS
jgi:hypothetical protein